MTVIENFGVSIRMASNSDVENIKALVFGVLDEFGLEPDLAGTDLDLLDTEASYIDRGGIFEVLEDDNGELVGTIGLYPLDDRTIELRKMYFAPEVRGRGLGGWILERTIENARNLGYLSIYLETASVLRQAVHLYEKFGFLPVDVKHTPRCDQGYVLELSGKYDEGAAN